MSDNTPTDLYHYKMVVYTGGRRHAATQSNVYFMVVGDEGETEVRKLESIPKKKVHFLFLLVFRFNTKDLT